MTLGAAPALAGYPGYYLATFTYPEGNFQHCFQLTRTDQYQGYNYSGTWVDTDYPDTQGTWVVFKKTIHLAGYVDGGGYLTADGKVGDNTLSNATFDYFDSSGIYFSAGSLTEENDANCSSPRRNP